MGRNRNNNSQQQQYYYYYSSYIDQFIYTIIFRMVLLWYFCTTKLSGTFGKVPQKYHSRIKILMAFLYCGTFPKVPQKYHKIMWYFCGTFKLNEALARRY